MTAITTVLDVDAPAGVVWDVLTDFATYPEWNDQTRIEGSPTVGSRLTVAPGPAAGRMPTFRPDVLVADGRELRWLGHLWVPGLFDGEHAFVVEDRGDGRSRLTQSERFSGLLAGPLFRLYGERTEAGFAAVNEALKARAEAIVTA